MEDKSFPLTAQGVESVITNIGDWTPENFPRVQFDRGEITEKYHIVEYEPSRIKQTIRVEYLAEYFDALGQRVPRESDGIPKTFNMRFDAAKQEGGTEYFYKLKVGLAPDGMQELGQLLDKMTINGLLIHLFGEKVFCYASSNGGFYYPTTLTLTVTPETGTYEPVEIDGQWVNQWIGNNDATVTFNLIDHIGDYTFFVGATQSTTNNVITGLSAGEYDYFASSPKSMPNWGKVIIDKQPI